MSVNTRQWYPHFLASELDTKQNCYKLWLRVTICLTNSDIATVRAVSYWKVLFGIKFDDCGDFLAFYKKLEGIIHKLKRGNFVAVTDDVFLKAYFTMGVKAFELQTEARSFLKYPLKLYAQTS